jgi:hypothetical protein
MDDRKVDWHFDSFKKIVSEMDSSKTTVGGIMAAMIYQIEKQSKRQVTKEEPVDAGRSFGRSAMGSISHSIPQHDEGSRESKLSQPSLGTKDHFMHELDTLF